MAYLFALETAMRAGEICGLRPEDIQGRVAHVCEQVAAFDNTVGARQVQLNWGGAARTWLLLLPDIGLCHRHGGVPELVARLAALPDSLWSSEHVDGRNLAAWPGFAVKPCMIL